jgi:hypothetical protein
MATTPKFQFLLCWIFLAFLLDFTVLVRCQIEAQTIPAGWVLYPTPKEGSFSIQCASASVRPQRVSLSDNGQLDIQQLPASYERDEYSKQQLPQGVKRQQRMTGRQSLLKMPGGGGWLLGFDAGEFGGGLWSVDPSGNTHELSRQNVRGLVDTPQGVLVFVGLAHLGLDSGNVLIVPYTATSKAEVKTLAKLEGAPEALTRISSDTALVVTTHGITEISSSGSTKTLLHADFSPLYPNSVVSTPDGTVYVGMRLFVVRFDPHAEHNAEQWFLPQSCESFETTGCVCTG